MMPSASKVAAYRGGREFARASRILSLGRSGGLVMRGRSRGLASHGPFVTAAWPGTDQVAPPARCTLSV